MNKRFFVYCIASLIALILAWGAIIYHVDPGQQYRDSSYHDSTMSDRVILIGLARNTTRKLAIVGASTSVGLQTKVVEQIFHQKCYNYSINGSPCKEHLKIINILCKNPHTEQIIYGLDFPCYENDPDMSIAPAPLMYYSTLLSKINPHYLFTPSIYPGVFQQLKGGANYKSNEEVATALYGDLIIDKSDCPDKFLIKTKAIYHPYNMTMGFLKRLRQKNLEANRFANLERLVNVVKDNPHIKFSIYFPPYSDLWWCFAEQYEYLDGCLEFKKRCIEQLSVLPNVELSDFQNDTRLISNTSDYMDVVHYHNSYAPFLLQAMKDGSYLIDKEKLNSIYRIKEIISERKKHYTKLLQSRMIEEATLNDTAP